MPIIMAFLSLLVCAQLPAVSYGRADDTLPPTRTAAAAVFIVFAIDTEPSRINPWIYRQEPDISCLKKSGDGSRVAPVMDGRWRSRYTDAAGGHPKITWFVMTHEAFLHAPESSACVVYDAMMTYRDEISEYGDELAWHYHHAYWIDPDGDGTSSWNQLTTFDGRPYTHGTDVAMAEGMLNRLLVDCGFFPTAFRSGWIWEDNALSLWLDDIIPFDFSASPQNRGKKGRPEPARNQFDWTTAPTTYAGYHPDERNYQSVGSMRRWIFRTIAPNTRREWQRILRAAQTGDHQVLCYTAHSYENLRRDIDDFLPALLLLADSMGIPVTFATATQAGAAIGSYDQVPKPELSLFSDHGGVAIRSNVQIFQPVPYCVMQDSSGLYTRLHPLFSTPGRWRIDPLPTDCVCITCAVSDYAGAVATAVFRNR